MELSARSFAHRAAEDGIAQQDLLDNQGWVRDFVIRA
jgi:hypothetical protein